MPIVIELGERDIDQGVVTMTRRDDPELARDAIPREGAAMRWPACSATSS